MQEGWPEVGGQRGDRMMTALFPIFDPFPGYFFTWTWRHRVSKLGRYCSLQRWGRAQRAGLERPAPLFLPVHIGAFPPSLPIGTAGLTPSLPSGSLTSSTSVPMRECHPSKGEAEGGDPLTGGSVVPGCSLLPVASWGLDPGQLGVPFLAFTPVQPQPPAPGPLRPETS